MKSNEISRISIIGGCGAGKSTLAKKLHRVTGIPIVHIDKVFWNEGWKPSEVKHFQSDMLDVYNQKQWIIDGHYYSTLEDRLKSSDTVFYLDYPTYICFFRLLKRIFKGIGKERPDCAPGCPERFNLEFLLYTLKFRNNFRSKTVKLLGKYPHLKVYRFSNPKTLDAYLELAERSANSTASK